MFSFKSIVLIAGALAVAESSGVPAAVAAPLVAQTHVGYTHAVPDNIPPYASQYSVVNRAASPLIAAPFAAPIPGPVAAPLATPFAAPYAAPAPYAPYAAPAPYLAGPAPVPAPYAFPGAPFPGPAFAGPLPYSPYGAAAPLLRTPYGYAPTFVR